MLFFQMVAASQHSVEDCGGESVLWVQQSQKRRRQRSLPTASPASGANSISLPPSTGSVRVSAHPFLREEVEPMTSQSHPGGAAAAWAMR